MKLIAALVAASAFAATTAAQAAMPHCATECLIAGLQTSLCAPTDTACICGDAVLVGNLTACVGATCTVRDGLTTRNMTATMCGEPVRDITAITPVLTGISGGLAILLCALRFIQFHNYINPDDIFILLSVLAATPMGVLEFIMSIDGFGKDIWTIPFENITKIVKYTWVTEILYILATGWIKLAFLFLYLRIFPSQTLRRIVWTVIGLVVAYVIAFTLSIVFYCTPISFTWNGWDGQHEGKCFNFNTFAWIHAAVNIILDITVVVLPLSELLKLSLNKRKKVYLVAMFTVGLFTTIFSIIRLHSLVRFAKTINPTYDNVPTAYWSVLEAYVGIICACMPAARHFLGKLLPSCFGSTLEKSNTRTRTRIITKTVSTSVVKERKDEDDEVNLVELGVVGKCWEPAQHSYPTQHSSSNKSNAPSL